jgi:hypothetical protein
VVKSAQFYLGKGFVIIHSVPTKSHVTQIQQITFTTMVSMVIDAQLLTAGNLLTIDGAAIRVRMVIGTLSIMNVVKLVTIKIGGVILLNMKNRHTNID